MTDAVQVTNADFNGHSFDGYPFSAAPDWLKVAIEHELISVYPCDRDYAAWNVQTPSGNIRALPGDWIVRQFGGDLNVIEQTEGVRDSARLPIVG